MIDKKLLVIVAAVAVIAVAGVGIYMITQSDSNNNTSTSETTSYTGKAVEKDANGLWVYKDTGKVAPMKCDPYTFKDCSGKSYTFDHTFGPDAAIYSAYGGPLMTMMALFGDNVTKYLSAIDKESLETSGYAWFLEKMPELKELPAIDGTSATPIIASKAEVFIHAWESHDSISTMVGQLETAGIPTFYLDFQSEDPEKIYTSIMVIGYIYGVSEKAKEIAELYKSKTSTIYSKAESLIAANGGVRPIIYGENGGFKFDQMMNSYGNTVQWGGIVYNIGGQALPDQDGNDPGKYPTYTQTHILANKDKIVGMIAACNGASARIPTGDGVTKAETLAALEKTFTQTSGIRAGYDEIKAYKDGNVIAVCHSLARNLCDFASVEAIAKIVWPDEYGDLDPEKDLKDFWNKYMPSKLKLEGSWYTYINESA